MILNKLIIQDFPNEEAAKKHLVQCGFQSHRARVVPDIATYDLVNARVDYSNASYKLREVARVVKVSETCDKVTNIRVTRLLEADCDDAALIALFMQSCGHRYTYSVAVVCPYPASKELAAQQTLAEN